MDSTPEAQARRNFDAQRDGLGWTVQDYKHADITAYVQIVSLPGFEKRARAIIEAIVPIEEENKSLRGVLSRDDPETCCGARNEISACDAGQADCC